ncbi:hypothetical protein PS028_24240, partial [Shigella sonnei]|nr:hypothetical protein [Shigella sonnei]
ILITVIGDSYQNAFIDLKNGRIDGVFVYHRCVTKYPINTTIFQIDKGILITVSYDSYQNAFIDLKNGRIDGV